MTGVWWRQVPLGRDPLEAPPAPPDGRWRRGERGGATYLAETAETAWAEWYRLLAEAGLPPHRALPRDLWRFRVDLEVADLSTDARLRAVGLTRPRPSRAEWPDFQDRGERLAEEGWAGLVVPSAARADGLVLCLFRGGGRRRGLRRLPPPRAVVEMPAPPRGMSS